MYITHLMKEKAISLMEAAQTPQIVIKDANEEEETDEEAEELFEDLLDLLDEDQEPGRKKRAIDEGKVSHRMKRARGDLDIRPEFKRKHVVNNEEAKLLEAIAQNPNGSPNQQQAQELINFIQSRRIPNWPNRRPVQTFQIIQ